MLKDLAASADPDLRWIARENLKKKRLTRPHPDQVETVQAILDRES